MARPAGKSSASGSPSSAGGRGPGGRERRKSRRTDVCGLWCDRGQILDMSARGMRLTSFRRWSEGQVRRLTISDGEVSVTIDARCIWCRQEGMFSHLVGVAFEGDSLDERRDEALARLARQHARDADDLADTNDGA